MNKQIIGFALAGLMTLGLFPGVSSAASIAELQAQLAQLQTLLAQQQGGSSTYNHIATLRIGSRGEQVKQLQSCMNRLGYSTGIVDGIFGNNTASGVKAFQASKGLVADGIIGMKTGPQFESACRLGTTVTENPVNPTTPKDGTEGSVDTYSLGSADESEALEGEKKVEIYAVDVELDDDGDLLLERVDVWFANSDGASEANPWAYFKKIHLLVDGKEVASMDADASSDWSKKSDGKISVAGTTKEYRMRFSGLKEVFESDETTTVSIAVTMANTIDTADQSAVWNVEVDDTAGFRWVDGTGFVFTEGAGGTALEDSFTIGNEETASIDLSLSSDDIKATVLGVNKSSDTNGVAIAIYNVEEDRGIDVTIDTIEVGLAIVDPAGGVVLTSASSVIKKAYLVVGGKTIGSETVPSGTLTPTVIFDNLKWELDGDEDKDVKVVVDFKDTNTEARYQNGTTIQVTSFAITEIEDANGNDEGDISTLTTPGASYIHELRDEGIRVTFVKSSNVKTTGTAVNDTVEFTLEFDVTAFGNDAYIDKTCVVGTTGTDVDAVEISAEGGLTPVCTNLDSTGDEKTDGFKVKKGTTERFTVNILVDGENGTQHTSSTVRARINGIGYVMGTDGAGDTVYAFDMTNYKSNAVTIYDRTL